MNINPVSFLRRRESLSIDCRLRRNDFIFMATCLFLFFACLLIFPIRSSHAAKDYYQFTTPAEQQRFTLLTSELRCLVCQNQNLAESNAALAEDLRNQVYQQMKHGQSDQQIINYLVSRYGDFILYKPPFNTLTLGLWLGPFFILLFSIGYLVYYLTKKPRE